MGQAQEWGPGLERGQVLASAPGWGLALVRAWERALVWGEVPVLASGPAKEQAWDPEWVRAPAPVPGWESVLGSAQGQGWATAPGPVRGPAGVRGSARRGGRVPAGAAGRPGRRLAPGPAGAPRASAGGAAWPQARSVLAQPRVPVWGRRAGRAAAPGWAPGLEWPVPWGTPGCFLWPGWGLRRARAWPGVAGRGCGRRWGRRRAQGRCRRAWSCGRCRDVRRALRRRAAGPALGWAGALEQGSAESGWGAARGASAVPAVTRRSPVRAWAPRGWVPGAGPGGAVPRPPGAGGVAWRVWGPYGPGGPGG